MVVVGVVVGVVVAVGVGVGVVVGVVVGDGAAAFVAAGGKMVDAGVAGSLSFSPSGAFCYATVLLICEGVGLTIHATFNIPKTCPANGGAFF